MGLSIKEKLAAKKAKQMAAAGGAPAPAPAPAPKPAPQPEPAPEPVPVTADEAGDVPPWAQPGCKACEGTGFNSKGDPCRICDLKAKKNGQPVSSTFALDVDDGMVTWAKGDEVGGRMLPGAVTAQVREEIPPAPEPAPAPVPAPTAEERPTRKKVGRPAKGFTLMLDCVTIKGRGKPGSGNAVFFLADIIRGCYEQMAAANQVDSVYDLDPFKRREALCRMADVIAEDVGTDAIAARTDTPDERELARALQSRATYVIQGLAR